MSFLRHKINLSDHNIRNCGQETLRMLAAAQMRNNKGLIWEESCTPGQGDCLHEWW
jgi:hypothetical protein